MTADRIIQPEIALNFQRTAVGNMFWFAGLLAAAFAVIVCADQACERSRRKLFVEREALTLDDWIRSELGESYFDDSQIVRRVLEVIAPYIKCAATQLRANDRFDNELALRSCVWPDDTLTCIEEEAYDLIEEISGKALPIKPEELGIASIRDVIDRVREYSRAGIG